MKVGGTIRFKVSLRGVHIGPTCIDGSAFTVTERGEPEGAHAHTTGSRPVGWICAKTLGAFRDLMVHEVAHLATDAGHDDRWRRSVRQLGGRVPAAYKKRSRKEAR